MNKLINAQDIAKRDGKPTVQYWIREISEMRRDQAGGACAWDGKTVTGQAVHPMVNQGRVLAQCPICGGYEYVCAETPVFYCMTCFNGSTSAGVPVEFPVDWKRVEAALVARPIVPGYGRNEIEAALRSKPVFRQLARAWSYGTSAEMLEEENRSGGLG